MSDIVEELRKAKKWLVINGDVGIAEEVAKAEDEIEKLRLVIEEGAEEVKFLLAVINVERKDHKEDIEAERKKHEWICVKDRLPEDKKQNVLVVANDGRDKLVTICFDIYGINETLRIGNETARITHWMPLPDPPKGEEE